MKKANFGNKLIEIRKAKGLTQEEVAEKCNISVRTIQRIESGSAEPRAFTIKLISESLGFDFFETSNTGYEVEEKGKNSKERKRSVILWYIKDLFNLKTNAMKKVSILSVMSFTLVFSIFFLVTNIKAGPSSEKQMSITTTKSRPNYIKTKERIEVAFTNEFTIDSLTYIKNDLKDLGITLRYIELKFDNKEHLSSINAEVECDAGFKGSFSTGSLDLPEVKEKDRRFGFYRDYSPNAKSSFGTGLIEN